MLGSFYRSLWADPYGAPCLIRRVLLQYGRPYAATYIQNFLLLGVTAGCTAITAYLIGNAVNVVYLAHSFAGVAALSAAIVIIFTIKGLATYGSAVMMARMSTELTADIQQRLFDKLLQENLGYFADRHSSQFSSQVTYSSASVPAVLNLLITAAARDLASVVGLFGVMVVRDPLLSLVGVLVLPLAMLFLRKIVERVRSMSMESYAAGANIVETIQEAVQGLKVVKTLGLEDEMRRRVGASAQNVKEMSNKLTGVSNCSTPLMETLGGFVIAIVFFYGGYRVIVTGAPPGEFVSFVTAFLLAYGPAKRLGRMHLSLHLQLTGLRMLFECLDAPPTEPAKEDKPPLKVSRGRIELRGLTFAYSPDCPVIRDLSLVAEAGCLTALVGESGAGKSTTFNLILRLYEPLDGAVIIDGQDIAKVSRCSVREQIAYVSQDVFLFRGTVRDNIALGKPGAEEAEIVAAAEAACAHDFIMSLPKGYDSLVGEHGLQLSTGQRQRVAIARALLKDAPIVLLDEPTSSLDSETERDVQQALDRLRAGRTTLVIAHRLYTVQHADRIYVIENGAAVEAGRHRELLAGGGRYARLYALQFEGAERGPKLPISGSTEVQPRKAAAF